MPDYHKLKIISLFILVMNLSVFSSRAEIPHAPVPSELKSILRIDHPRIFFNIDSFPAVKSRTLNEDAGIFNDMKARIDKLATTEFESKDYGIQASEAAFVWLVTGDDTYLRLAKKLLETSIAYYHECYAQQKPVDWYAYSRICAWAAYDWMFNRLTDTERKALGVSFLDAVEQVQPTDTRHYFYPQENWSGYTTGFYGNRSLLWYAGLATYGENIDDRGEWFLAEGYRLNMELLNHRRKGAGDDGGSATASQNYAMAAYPWSEFNFFHTFRSATGENIALDWPHASYLPGYLYWNMLPGQREFGVGDAYHSTNVISLSQMRSHLLQIIHFFGDSNPECAAFARWMMSQVPEGNFGRIPFTPFLLTERHEDLKPIGPAEVMPCARHFENMGQVFFRSGSGENDTYTLLMSGGMLEQHKHFDNNHFAIFKRGFLALDTGSRPHSLHTQNYYPRTVAHNCILIDMPGEQLPVYVDVGAGGGQRWGAPAPEEEDRPVPNDGGQYKLLGSKIVAFETKDDYSYAAGDATESYSPEKCKLALRQFVFLYPDYFVIFDRVVSTDPGYKKSWLLHTATEPDIRSDTFSASQEQGKLFARTLLPQQTDIVKIGGPGKQFWVDGHNYAMPKGHATPDSTQLLGQWRIEVSPKKESTQDYFLHFIQAGDQSLGRMVDSGLIRDGSQVGVRFTDGSKAWEVLFGTKGDA
ncbi:MAG: heparinase II/III family protein, partial [Candidatus Latescibacteria bacterium]|nr:heparinase II/III family protein [Candidatus Latescibacterota bacterium]